MRKLDREEVDQGEGGCSAIRAGGEATEKMGMRNELTSTSEPLATTWSCSTVMLGLGTARSLMAKVVESTSVDILIDVDGFDGGYLLSYVKVLQRLQEGLEVQVQGKGWRLSRLKEEGGRKFWRVGRRLEVFVVCQGKLN
jgi:hypothetical protein